MKRDLLSLPDMSELNTCKHAESDSDSLDLIRYCEQTQLSDMTELIIRS